MTLEQAVETIKEFYLSGTVDDLILSIHFNTEDEWFDATIYPVGDPQNNLAGLCGEGFLENAIIGLAKELDAGEE